MAKDAGKLDQIRALREARMAETRGLEVGDTVSFKPSKKEPAVKLTVKSTTTFQYRSPEKRRAYMAAYMRKRRAKLAARRQAKKRAKEKA